MPGGKWAGRGVAWYNVPEILDLRQMQTGTRTRIGSFGVMGRSRRFKVSNE